MKNHKNLSYVLITPARNEDAFIEKTIQSVVSQTVLPKRWIIVSDGSTDRTDEIVKKYASRNNWIELLRMPEHKERHFAAKAICFNAGCQRIKSLKYDIIGNLDADLSFEKDYFEFLLDKFAENAGLGVAGTPFVENSFQYDYNFTNIEHVSGACQLFRRKCFEEIGGYMLIKGGGIDFVAVTTARMKGWKTRTFPDKNLFHHRKIGTGNNSYMMSWFRQGVKDYSLGNHLLWEIFRACYQMTKKPYILGGLFLSLGYARAFLSGMEMPVSQKLVKFNRNGQMLRLKNIFYKPFKNTMKIEGKKKKYLIATMLLAVFILYFSVIPVMSMENITLNAGTLRHMAAYFLFAFAIYKTTDNPKIAFLSAGTYGMLIECVQYFIPYRTFSLFDILTNYAGACFVLILKRKS